MTIRNNTVLYFERKTHGTIDGDTREEYDTDSTWKDDILAQGDRLSRTRYDSSNKSRE